MNQLDDIEIPLVRRWDSVFWWCDWHPTHPKINTVNRITISSSADFFEYDLASVITIFTHNESNTYLYHPGPETPSEIEELIQKEIEWREQRRALNYGHYIPVI